MMSQRPRYTKIRLFALAVIGLLFVFWKVARPDLDESQDGISPTTKAMKSATAFSGARDRRNADSIASPPLSPGDAANNWDDCKTLTQLQKAYAELLATKEGSELTRLSYLLIGQASKVLGLDDMDEFALGFNDIGTLSTAMMFVGKMAASELDQSTMVKWMQTRSDDPSYAGALSAIGANARSGDVPKLIEEAGQMKNKWLATHLLSGILGSGNAESIKSAIDAYNKGYDGSLFDNMIEAAPESLMEMGKVDEALDVCGLISKDTNRVGAYRRLLIKAVAVSPSQATELFGRIPTEQERAGAVDALVSSWSTSSLPAASKWVSELPSGIVRDSGAVSISRSVLILSPREALTWADSIESDALRKAAVTKVLEHLKRTDLPLWEQITKTR